MQRLKVPGAHVGEFPTFEIAPDLFDGVQFGRVARQRFDSQPTTLARKVRAHAGTLVPAQAVPDEDDAPPAEMALELPQKADQPDVLVRARLRLEVKPAAASIPAEGQGACDRQALPVPTGMGQERGLAARGPGAADNGLLREAAFVFENEPRVASAGVFFSCAQRRVFHCSMAVSFRSRARRAGRWRDHPNRRRIRQTCPGWCRTPVTRVMTAATRGKVHRSVRNPCAAGPARSAPSTVAKASASNCGLRPARPAPFSPGRPRTFHAWYQWCALTRVTPSCWATAACETPRANSRAACSRRASNAAKSRRGVDMRQHAMIPAKSVSIFSESH